jgi:hypothetical protein
MAADPLLSGGRARMGEKMSVAVVAVAVCGLGAVAACLLAATPRAPVQLLTKCTSSGCAAVSVDKLERTRTSQLQMASRSAAQGRTRSAMPDVGILGRVGKVGESRAPARRAYRMPDVGLLGRVDKISKTKTPSLKSWNIGHSFEGSGTGPKWENDRTAVIGHHAGDPKIIESASDEIARASSREHERYYYDEDHDDNGNLLEGGNDDAPEWWQKGKAGQRRPYVTWGSRYADELEKDEHKDDTRLVNAGVNVESHRDFFRGMPLPWCVSAFVGVFVHGLVRVCAPAGVRAVAVVVL